MSAESPAATRAVSGLDGLAYWTARGFWAVLDQALFAISNLVLNVLLARWLHPVEYGAFVTANVVLLLVGVLHSSLLSEPMVVLGPSRYARQFEEYFSILLRFHWRFGALATATLLLVGAIAYAWGTPLLGSSFVGLACAAPLIFLSWLLRRVCYVERKPAVAALGGAVYFLFTVLGAILLYSLGYVTSMAAQLLMGAGGTAAAVVILRMIKLRVIRRPPSPRSAPIDTRLVWREHQNFLRWSGSSGLLYFAEGLIFYLVLPFFGGLQAAAALRAMTNFIMPVMQSDSALANLIAPELARAGRSASDVSTIVRWARRLFLLEGVICWLVVALFRHDLVRFIYGERYLPYADLLLVQGALPLVASQVNVLGAVLRLQRRVRPIFWSGAAAAAVALVVGFATMPRLGVLGAVTAMVLAESVRMALMTYFLGRPKALAADDADSESTRVGTRQSPQVLEIGQ